MLIDVTGDNHKEEGTTPLPVDDSYSPAIHQHSPMQSSIIKCSLRGRGSPKILADAGFTPNRNKTATKYAKFFFGDNQVRNCNNIL
jgi:hypothetical protein